MHNINENVIYINFHQKRLLGEPKNKKSYLPTYQPTYLPLSKVIQFSIKFLATENVSKNLKLLKAKVQKKKEENDKVEEEILQMQLSLKERKRIYNIQQKSSEGANEARKRRLKQVMMVSKLKRARQVQEARIAELNEEVARLRKCVYTSFNEGEDFEAMVGYNH